MLNNKYNFPFPITRRMDKAKFNGGASKWTPRLISLTQFFCAIKGRAEVRLLPIVEFSYIGLFPELN